jgi:hypothetical protein
MSVKGGPDIVTDGLVFNLDAAGAVSDKAYPINGLPVEYLIVAGGGGGGGVIGGGGGAGGLLHGYTRASLSTGSYTVTVGAGGAGGTGWNTSGQAGKVGGNSTVFSLTANGGGGGRHYGSATTSTVVNGGSGGGGAYGGTNGGTGVAGQGYNGGGGGTSNVGGGGGGAGSAGSNANNSLGRGGHGGVGKYFGNILGNSVGYNGWFADGGGGGVRYNRTRGLGLNGAGDGGNHNNDTLSSGITNAAINTGSGGGGAGYSGSSNSRIGGNGGSGVVIIKYLGPQKATGGDSIITKQGFTIHVFTSSGTFTVGGRVADLSTSKIVGTLTNMDSSNYNSSNRGYFTFDGSNEYIDIDRSLSSVGVEATIETFFRSTSTSSPGCFLLGWGYQNLHYSSFGIGNWFGTWEDESIHLGINSAALILAERGGHAKYHDGNWYHAVATIGVNKYKIYVNAIELTTSFLYGSQSSNFSGIFNAGGNSIVRVSSRPYGGGSGFFEGDIAFMKVYNRVLSAKEILDNYNATKGRFGL